MYDFQLHLDTTFFQPRGLQYLKTFFHEMKPFQNIGAEVKNSNFQNKDYPYILRGLHSFVNLIAQRNNQPIDIFFN